MQNNKNSMFHVSMVHGLTLDKHSYIISECKEFARRSSEPLTYDKKVLRNELALFR